MGRVRKRQLTSLSAAALEEVVARIGRMSVEQLRGEWRETFGLDARPALSKDLLARALAFQLQERALGGLSSETRRLLRSLTQEGIDLPRRIKIGSIIVREYEGRLHEVLVVPDGFCWEGKTYPSLSTIARALTGTSWNGPRFFGLRAKDRGTLAAGSSKEEQVVPGPTKLGAGRRSSIRNGQGVDRLLNLPQDDGERLLKCSVR